MANVKKVKEIDLSPVSYTHLDVYKRQSIHRADCINVGNSINQERLINVSWNRDVLKENKTFEADIKITANDRIGLSAEITTIISNEGFNMSNFSAASDNKYGSVVNISLHVHNTMELEDLFRKLKNVQGIKEVYRV